MDPRKHGAEGDPLPGAVERLCRREEGAAEDVDRILRPRLLRYFRSGPWPPDEAEDLVQMTLARVFKSVEELRSQDRFLPWVFTIARNVRTRSSERWVTRRSFETVGLEGAAEPRAPDEAAAPVEEERRAERAAALERALERLPERQRQCLLLQSRERMSYEEIAATLRLSVHTVRNHIAQARESLRQRLAGAREVRK